MTIEARVIAHSSHPECPDLIKRDDALLPCPFCGCGLARTVMDTGFSGVELMGAGTDHPYVWCGTCGASGSFEEDDNKAIAAWNTRALPAVDLPALTPNLVDDSKTANPVVNDPATIREAALLEAMEIAKACERQNYARVTDDEKHGFYRAGLRSAGQAIAAAINARIEKGAAE